MPCKIGAMMPIDQCDECDAYDGCPQFAGKIDARGLARFLFDHSNASNDGARVMEMMDSMARGLLEHLEVSRKVGF